MTAVQWLVGIGCVCAVAMLPRPADAQVLPPAPVPGSPPPQGPATRPLRPLFGISAGSFEQSLTAGLSFGAGYDVERATYQAPVGLPSASEIVTNGMSGFGNVHLAYVASRDRFSLGASVRGAGFYYRRVSTGLRYNSGASVQGSLRLWETGNLAASHELTYAPYHFTAMTPAEVFEQQQTNPNFVDPSVFAQSTFHHRSSVAFAQSIPLTRRISGTAGYGFSMDRQGQWGSHRHEARAGLSFGIARGLRARVGYQYGVGRSRSGGMPGPWGALHNIDSGIDFNRQLSLSRRLGLSFRTGFAMFGDVRTTHFTATGGVRLHWAISRNWSASTSFNRDVQFYDDVQAVAVSNWVNAGLRGTLSRRLSLHAGVGMSSIDRGFGTGDNSLRWTRGIVGLSSSLGSHLSVGVDYTNAYYSFGKDIALFPGVPQQRHRQAVMGRVTLFAPLYVMTRRE